MDGEGRFTKNPDILLMAGATSADGASHRRREVRWHSDPAGVLTSDLLVRTDMRVAILTRERKYLVVAVVRSSSISTYLVVVVSG